VSVDTYGEMVTPNSHPESADWGNSEELPPPPDCPTASIISFAPTIGEMRASMRRVQSDAPDLTAPASTEAINSREPRFPVTVRSRQ